MGLIELLYSSTLEPERGSSLCDKQAGNPDSYTRSVVSQCIGLIGGREAYHKLKGFLSDREHFVRYDAIIELGKTKDSRALFTLVKHWNSLTNDTMIEKIERERILLAVNELEDPRAKEWLESLDAESYLLPLIHDAKIRSKYSSATGSFLYTFIGSEKTRKAAESKKGAIIRSYDDLARIEDALEDDLERNFEKPQTYIVNRARELVLGGWLNEHVETASGDEVLGAGEARLEKSRGRWGIKWINNRSNGYYPGESFAPVRQALSNTGIEHPDGFDNVYPRDGPMQSYFSEEFLELWTA